MVTKKSRKKTKEKKPKKVKLREHGKWWYDDYFPANTVDGKGTVRVEAWRVEVYVTNKKSFYIAVYPINYLNKNIKKGWNYEIDAVSEFGEFLDTYGYYQTTGKYFKTLKEAKENALVKASKMRWPEYG
jgi:phage gp29-like protein